MALFRPILEQALAHEGTHSEYAIYAKEAVNSLRRSNVTTRWRTRRSILHSEANSNITAMTERSKLESDSTPSIA